MGATAKAAVVFLSLWLCQVRGSYIPVEMNRTIQNLLQYYDVPEEHIFNGKPVFSREPLSGKTEAKMIFMGGVLETYEKLISHMLQQLSRPSGQTAGSDQRPASDAAAAAAPATAAASAQAGADGNVRKQLTYILKQVQGLRKHRFGEQEKLLKELRSLNDIKTDNSVIQSKALWELPWLYEEASSLSASVTLQRRRRRQARRVRSRPRV